MKQMYYKVFTLLKKIKKLTYVTTVTKVQIFAESRKFSFTQLCVHISKFYKQKVFYIVFAKSKELGFDCLVCLMYKLKKTFSNSYELKW